MPALQVFSLKTKKQCFELGAKDRCPTTYTSFNAKETASTQATQKT